MKLTILGGAAASPNTGMGCSGYLVTSGGTNLLIDPGPGTLQELRRHTDFRNLSAVIVSHMHLDHCLDLVALRHALAYNPIAAPRPTPVWLPPGGAAFLARVTAPFDECDEPGHFAETIDVTEYEPDGSLPLGDITIAFRRTVHIVPAWAMRIESRTGESLGYTADTGPTADLAPFFTGVDLLLTEATLQDPVSEPAHSRGSLTASEAGTLAINARAGRLILTHYWEEYDSVTQLASATKTFPGLIELAHAGLTIIW